MREDHRLRIARGMEALPAMQSPRLVSVGTFDGVHRGHRAVLAEMVRVAREARGESWAVSFDPHPQEVLRPDTAPALLTTVEERERALEPTGIDGLLWIPFTREFSQRSGESFLRELLARSGTGSGLVVGPTTRLGRDRSMGLREIRQLADEEGWRVVVIDPVEIEGTRVNSSRIRRLLLAGEAAAARRLLGRPYSFTAPVVRGHGRGQALRCPTANLATLAGRKLLPGDGVYAGWAEPAAGRHEAAISIGTRPSFGGGPRVVEVHLLDFEGALAGEVLCVHLSAQLREQRTFESAGALADAMADDVAAVRSVLRGDSPDRPPEGGDFPWPAGPGAARMGAQDTEMSGGR